MRIVLVNWAKIWHGASRGGGINGYTQALALDLVKRGHEVVSLTSGTTEHSDPTVPNPGSCHARRHRDWLGIRVFEIVNAPVKAPSKRQFEEPEAEISSPVLERVVTDLLAMIEPDIVHIQSLEGFTAGCIAAAASSGASVLMSLHNYHTICPQVYLMQGRRVPCTSFDNGHACVGCLTRYEPSATTAGTGSPRYPSRPVRSHDDTLSPLGVASADTRGQTLDILRARGDRPMPPPIVPFSNDPMPEPPSNRKPNAYAHRRSAMIDALNRCDRVLAVSTFVAGKFEALGVRPDRIETITIGTSMVEMARAAKGALVQPLLFADHPDRPIRLVFMGYHNPAKGLALLIDAIESLDRDAIGRFHLCVHAKGVESIAPRLRRLESRLARLTISGGYDHTDIPWLIGGADLGVVPSIWWDNGPQTVLEMLACRVPVLGARVGGIPDFIEHDRNGVLFTGGDVHDLARQLTEVTRNPTMLDRLRSGVTPPKTMAEHVSEIEAVYRRAHESRDSSCSTPAKPQGSVQASARLPRRLSKGTKSP